MASADAYLEQQLNTLQLSALKDIDSSTLLRAAAWHNQLLQLGLELPLFAVADLGAVLSGRRRGSTPGSESGQRSAAAGYHALLAELSEVELVQEAGRRRLDDGLLVILLARLLNHLYQRWPQRMAWVGAAPLALTVASYRGPGAGRAGRPAQDFRDHLVSQRLYLLTAIEQIDLDTVRLLSLFHGEGADLADLSNVLASPEAHNVVNFSLELLPSVLEAKRSGGLQSISLDGYAGLRRNGTIDTLILSELACDQDIFEQKFVDNELLYYAHERQHEQSQQLHLILIDSSASMRGRRETFARGLALTLAKKLALQGSDVVFRFFDSRLYPAQRISVRPGAAVPYLLCFRSERGRNYARAFRQLYADLKRRQNGDPRELAVYIITHGQCHVRKELVAKLAKLCHLSGIFILPSTAVQLDYLPLLDRHEIVDEQALASRRSSVNRALNIVHGP